MALFSQGSRWGLIAALACAVCAPAVRSLAQDAPSDTFPVRGVVVNSTTREPVARALVEGQGDAVLSDSGGAFELNLPAGVDRIGVRRPGYGAGPSEIVHVVQVGPNLPDITLSITPQAVIAGHITLSTGEDGDGVHITVYRLRMRGSQHWWETAGSVAANSTGNFRITNLPTPGQYLLMTTPTVDRTGPTHENTSGYPAVFYPEGSESSATSLLMLATGQQLTVELSLARQPFYPVAIAVRNDVGQGGVVAEIHDESGLARDFPLQWNAQKRVVEASLPNGRYYAELRTYDTNPRYGRIDFSVAGTPVSGLSMALLPLHPVLVEIHKDFTNPVNGQNGPPPGQPNPGINLTFFSAEGAVGPMGALEPVPGGSDPTLFRVAGLVPGRYWVRVNGYEGYVSSITSGGVDLSREAFSLGPGNTTEPIIVTVRNDFGQINGTLRSASPNAEGGATSISCIFAIPNAPNGSDTAAAPGLGGTFSIPQVAPGSYRVFALQQCIDVDSLEPAVLESYLAKGQPVTVEPNGTATLTLDAVPVGDAAPGGTVVDQ